MSSWVGPSPPQTITAVAAGQRVRRASTMRVWLSPTAWWKWESTPAAARCSPSQAELVSAIWPSRSSVPMATISTPHDAAVVPGRTVPSARYWSPRHHGEGRRPARRRRAAGRGGGERRDQAGRDGEVLHQRLRLGRGPGGHRDPRRPEQERYTLIKNSRAPIRMTGSHGRTCW